MKNEITIAVSGKAKTGKSRVIYIIKEILKLYNIDVEFDPSPDFVNEQIFNRVMRIDLENAFNAKTKVVIKEEQLHI